MKGKTFSTIIALIGLIVSVIFIYKGYSFFGYFLLCITFFLFLPVCLTYTNAASYDMFFYEYSKPILGGLLAGMTLLVTQEEFQSGWVIIMIFFIIFSYFVLEMYMYNKYQKNQRYS